MPKRKTRLKSKRVGSHKQLRLSKNVKVRLGKFVSKFKGLSPAEFQRKWDAQSPRDKKANLGILASVAAVGVLIPPALLPVSVLIGLIKLQERTTFRVR